MRKKCLRSVQESVQIKNNEMEEAIVTRFQNMIPNTLKFSTELTNK